MRLHRNVNTSLNRLEKFIFTEWMYAADRTEELQSWLSPPDQIAYNLNIAALDWPNYFDDLAKGVRQYLNNEKLSNLPVARSKDTV